MSNKNLCPCVDCKKWFIDIERYGRPVITNLICGGLTHFGSLKGWIFFDECLPKATPLFEGVHGQEIDLSRFGCLHKTDNLLGLEQYPIGRGFQCFPQHWTARKGLLQQVAGEFVAGQSLLKT